MQKHGMVAMQKCNTKYHIRGPTHQKHVLLDRSRMVGTQIIGLKNLVLTNEDSWLKNKYNMSHQMVFSKLGDLSLKFIF